MNSNSQLQTMASSKKQVISWLSTLTRIKITTNKIYLNNSYTIDMERFAGLNIRDFSPMKFFADILSWCIGHQCLLLIAKNSQENFCGKLKNCESLAQHIFPRLRYAKTIHMSLNNSYIRFTIPCLSNGLICGYTTGFQFCR